MLMSFKHYNIVARVRRLVYLDWVYKKSDFQDTELQYRWHLKANTIENLIDKTAFGKEFIFTCARNNDIREWDKIQVWTAFYDVKGSSNSQWISFTLKKLIVYKAVWAPPS